MNRLILFAVVVIGVFPLSSCNYLGTPTPTPDVPRFAEGEAIAVVKEWLGEKTNILNPRLSCFYVLELGRDSVVWSENYLGDGVWLVTVSPNETLTSVLEHVDYAELMESNLDGAIILAALSIGGEWQVYEFTARVVSIRKSYENRLCR